MFSQKKEDKYGLPDLPPIKTPKLPSLNKPKNLRPVSDESQEDSEDHHLLPKFPDSPMANGISQAAIKEAVINEPPGQETEIKERNMDYSFSEEPVREAEVQSMEPNQKTVPSKTIEMEEWSPENESSMGLAPSYPHMSSPSKSQKGKSADIFVKIEKFQSAKRSLETIKFQLEEIEALLKKIRETKLREEQELSAWEKEMLMAKSRIKEVTETIFEKTQ